MRKSTKQPAAILALKAVQSPFPPPNTPKLRHIHPLPDLLAPPTPFPPDSEFLPEDAPAPTYPPDNPIPHGFDPEVHAKLIRALLDPDPDLLHTIARSEKFSLFQLSAWMNTPEVAALIDSFTRFFTLRAKILAHSQLADAIGTMQRITHQNLHHPADRIPSPEVQTRWRESTRKAAAAIIRAATSSARTRSTVQCGTGVPPVIATPDNPSNTTAHTLPTIANSTDLPARKPAKQAAVLVPGREPRENASNSSTQRTRATNPRARPQRNLHNANCPDRSPPSPRHPKPPNKTAPNKAVRYKQSRSPGQQPANSM